MLCSRCRHPHYRKGQRYCAACQAAYMRKWRISHPPTSEQRRKSSARAYARVYTQRGQLVRLDCEFCGSPESQRHHPDYARPLAVKWICKACHHRLHQLIEWIVSRETETRP